MRLHLRAVYTESASCILCGEQIGPTDNWTPNIQEHSASPLRCKDGASWLNLAAKAPIKDWQTKPKTEVIEVRLSYSAEEKERVLDFMRLLLKAIKETFPEQDAPVTVHVDVSQPN